jgi:hypothetical protein
VSSYARENYNMSGLVGAKAGKGGFDEVDLAEEDDIELVLDERPCGSSTVPTTAVSSQHVCRELESKVYLLMYSTTEYQSAQTLPRLGQ